MKQDAFSRYHPAVNFLFFLLAIGFGVVLQHPAYLLAAIVCSGSYYLSLRGSRGWKLIAGTAVMFALLTLVNPLTNTDGKTVLFTLFSRPVTGEALAYGAATASIFVIMMLWFGCYNLVMTSDKFTSLFGRLIPALSLLLVMVLRLIPNLLRRTRQIQGARGAIGKGLNAQSTGKEKLLSGTAVLSALTDWALESSIVTGDSMRSRGYGSAKRTSFQIYRMTMRDWVLLGIMGILTALVLLLGAVDASYTPEMILAPVTGTNLVGFGAYCALLLIPTILSWKEALLWHILRSRI